MTDDKKFIRIATKGFVPLFDTSNKEASKSLGLQIKTLAAGKLHEEVGKDPNLAGKSVKDLIAMIAAGAIAFRKASSEKGCLRPYLQYTEDVPCILGFGFEKMFIAPPVFEAKVDGEKLMVLMDLRIELKKLLRPSSLPKFLKAAASKKIKGITWDFTANKTVDPLGYSCRMFEQTASDYTFELFESKKQVLSAG